jgi:hypothetical protein
VYRRGDGSVTRDGIDAGVYINIFTVNVPVEPAYILSTPRSVMGDLRSAREDMLKRGMDIRFFAPGYSDKVYCYGRDIDYLRDSNFSEDVVSLYEVPKLTTRLIVEGITDQLTTEGYDIQFGKGRMIAFPSKSFRVAMPSMIKVYMGYDLRSTFWLDQFDGGMTYGLVVDVTWAFRDEHDRPMHPRQVAERNAMREVGNIQGEYLPGGFHFNTEVSRQRLVEKIMPFAKDHRTFSLPCGGNAELSDLPVRILIGGREG